MQRSYCSQIKLLQSFSQFFHKLLNLKDINKNDNNNNNTNDNDDDNFITIGYCYFLFYLTVLSGN